MNHQHKQYATLKIPVYKSEDSSVFTMNYDYILDYLERFSQTLNP